ncbi:NAD(P)-binding protein [Apiospora saccharicola]|uniref:NAD(P)-binding protein n=1 Tax=Apiospora saccharicola TaxID=335842 RepID=A0ABR1UY03_9PEZI
MSNSSESNTAASESAYRLDLVGHVAVITGASRGIGRAIAFNLALRGCSILGTCTNEASLDSISSGLDGEVTQSYQEIACLRPAQLRITGLIADIFSLDCSALIANKLEESFNGRVDILINSSCDPMPGIIGEMDIQEIQHSLLGNIQTPFMIVDELVRRQFFQPNSRIIYISSIRSKQPWSRHLLYAAGKSAGESLCRTWAQAFGGKEEKYQFMAGTTANSVLVGLTQTEAVMNCGPDMVAEFQNEFFPPQSIPRFGQPQDVADVVGLICSAEAKWITGSVISASGGGIKIG